MSSYTFSLTEAVVLFPLVAALFTVPFLIYQYRKHGAVPWLHALVVYSFIFYLMCAYFLVLLPLPADRTAVVAYAQTPQLVPFSTLHDLWGAARVEAGNPKSWLTLIINPYFYQIFFNVLLLLPLGAYLRYFFHRRWYQTLIIGFLVSLSFELSQLTGLWGIYEHPYRLFDVDDLISNTFGCMVGFWLTGPLLRILPDVRVAERHAKERGLDASVTRRALSFGLDFALAQVVAFAGLFAIGGSFADERFESLGSLSYFDLCELLALVVVFVLFPLVTKGQTPAQKLLHLRIVRPDASDARWYQIALRYPLLFVFLFLPGWLFGLVGHLGSVEGQDLAAEMVNAAVQSTMVDSGSVESELSDVAALAAQEPTVLLYIWTGLLVVWVISLIVRAVLSATHKRPFVMLNGLASYTRVMTLSGIELARSRRHVLDVSETVALEQAIDKSGTPLLKLMMLAGGEVASAIDEMVEPPARVCVLAGSGNNGGDGWVCARDLARKGYTLVVVTRRRPEALVSEPARTAAMAVVGEMHQQGLPITVFESPSAEELDEILGKARVVVDAVLGTGFSGDEVHEPYASWIEAANRRRFRGTPKKRSGGGAGPANRQALHAKHRTKAKDAPLVVSVDVPSGMSAQTGSLARPCIFADETVTMLALKPGLLAPGVERQAGVVVCAPLVDVDQYLPLTVDSAR